MKREVLVVLLPEGVSPDDVRTPPGSLAWGVWFDERAPEELVLRALSKIARLVAERIEAA